MSIGLPDRWRCLWSNQPRQPRRSWCPSPKRTCVESTWMVHGWTWRCRKVWLRCNSLASVVGTTMRFEILTIFPEIFRGFFDFGVVSRAQKTGLIEIGVRDLREFTHDRH